MSDLSQSVQSSLEKADSALQSHQQLKTINNQSIVGSGNITIEGGSEKAWTLVQSVVTTEEVEKIDLTFSDVKEVYIIYNIIGTLTNSANKILRILVNSSSNNEYRVFIGSDTIRSASNQIRAGSIMLNMIADNVLHSVGSAPNTNKYGLLGSSTYASVGFNKVTNNVNFGNTINEICFVANTGAVMGIGTTINIYTR